MPLPQIKKPKNDGHIGQVGGETIISAVTLTRPANATPYSALDAISNSTSAPNVLNFTGMSRNDAGSGYITKAKIMTDQAANAARTRLHLFKAAPTAINDKSPQTLLWANRANYIGFIDFDAMTTEGTGSNAAVSLNTAVRLAFACAAGDTTLYGLLETKDGFTPASGQNFYIELTAEQN